MFTILGSIIIFLAAISFAIIIFSAVINDPNYPESDRVKDIVALLAVIAAAIWLILL